jgi:hypothetical protein
MTFAKWSETKPEDRTDGKLLLWRTKHKRLGILMTFSGTIRSMRNGWNNTIHLLPPMTHWDGYKHLIPVDLEWSADVPAWIMAEATYKSKDKWGYEKTLVSEHKLEQLLHIEGLDPLPCPFTGLEARWDSRDGWIGAMPHEHQEFSVGRGGMRTGYYSNPRDAVAYWNRRAA